MNCSASGDLIQQKKHETIFHGVISVCLTLLLVLFSPLSSKAQTGNNQDIPIQHLRQFADVFAQIKQNYVENVDDQFLLEEAIRGMVSSLDDFSVYFNDTEFEDFRSDTQGRFGGIGVELILQKTALKVMTPIDDTPAQRAGILPGDLITHINGTAIFDFKDESPFDALKGEAGAPVTLTISRGNELPFDKTLVRAIIRIKTVKYETLEPGIAYMRIAQFQPDTPAAARKAITELLHQSNGTINSLILDLRNNPGGTLGGAIDISNLFLTQGVIVTIKDRSGNINGEYLADGPDYTRNAKIVVLVNHGSASASEIVAGALKVNKRATILGSTTYGKGSVQTVIPLNLDAALKLTTAKYYLGNGESIHEVGITPDIEFIEEEPTMLEDIKQQAIIKRALTFLKTNS